MAEFGFFLKKIVSFFVEPYGMVFILLIVGLYYFYKNKYGYAKLFLTIGFSVMFLYSYPPFSNFLIANLENQYPKYDYKSSVKYIHVLGSYHNTDEDQPLSSQLGHASIKRDIEGIIIFSKMNDAKIIFTGYEGKTNIPTANMNASLALFLGIGEENIIVNPKPKDTQEEAIFTKSIVSEEPFILVTSASHMPRAMMLFQSLGLHPIPAPTNFYKEKFEGYMRAPSVSSFYVSQIAMHEYIGIIWAKIKASI